MKTLRDESGQALILTVLCMTCLLGFVALAADVGTLLHAKRIVQTAADSAALAGAAQIRYAAADGISVGQAARTAAAQNGFTDGSGGVTVTVNNGPLSGPYSSPSNPGYVEVVIQQRDPVFFMKIFHWSSMTVKARAVAGLGAVNQGCIFVLAPSGASAMHLQGSFNVSAPNCGVVVNSNDPNGLDFTGGGGTLVAKSVGVVGGAGGQTGDSTPPPVTGIAPTNDPLSFVSAPDPNKLSCVAPSGGTLTGTINPPAGGIACYKGNVTLSNVFLNTGTYVFTGNVTFNGSVKTAVPTSPTSPLGATIDIATGTLSINTGTTLDIHAPKSGSAYDGIALMEPPPNTNQITIQKGNASGTVDGIIYAPKAALYLQDSGGDKSGGLTLITDLIVGTLYDKTATLTVQGYSQANPTTTLLRVPTLVE